MLKGSGGLDGGDVLGCCGEDGEIGVEGEGCMMVLVGLVGWLRWIGDGIGFDPQVGRERGIFVKRNTMTASTSST